MDLQPDIAPTRWQPAQLFDRPQELDGIEPGTFEVACGPLRMSGVFAPRDGADALVVLLKSNCDRRLGPPPVFLDWPPGVERLGHLLKICDPSLHLDDSMELCCFQGLEHADPIPIVVDIVGRFCGKLGVAPHRVVYFGISGAGFAALQCAIRDGTSVGVGLNPQLDMTKFAAQPFAEAMARVVRPGTTVRELCASLPTRFSIVNALTDARAQGRSPRLAILQNTGDFAHYHPHFLPFCRAFGVPATGGTDPTGRIRAVPFEAEGQHSGVPPEELVMQVLAESLELSSAG